MRPIARLTRGRKGLSFGGSGTFDVGPFWRYETRESEALATDFATYVEHAYKSNGVVFACILARQMVFSEARFQFQRLAGGRPGDLFGDPSLSILERPWPGGTTGELLSRMEQDASLSGNFYCTTVGAGAERRIRRLSPERVTIVTGSRSDNPFALDAHVVAYMYDQGHGDHVFLTPDQVCHYSPIPDPDAQWRGMSWITPVVREVQADSAATKHKQKFFENGAIPSIVLTYDPGITPDAFETFVAKFKDQHVGTDNAYKALHLGGGVDVTTVGADLKQLDFKVTQGAGETRIAAASGVGAVIAQLSEGLQGSALNAGNFSAAKRRFADGTIRPLWRTAAASLERIVPPPAAARLWYDARDIAFLQEDEKDEAAIQSERASTINSLITAGYEPDAVVEAVTAGDLRQLVGRHSGLYSVQLQAAGGGEREATAP